MIDRESRDALAQALRHYVAGLITNDDLDDIVVTVLCDARSDRGVVAVAEMAWTLYDDLHKHRATGKHALDKEGRHEVARWIAFLYSDEEYFWPEFSFIGVHFSRGSIWFHGLLIFALLCECLLINDLFPTGVFMRGGLLLAFGLCMWWWQGKYQKYENRWQTFQETGDFSVWPFLCREDLGRILPYPRLLSGRDVGQAGMT
ncbi:MAG: hypothetical protein LBB76_11400 [Azoarcus sp.]|jgi:hypothetical protein|nr:hypothetical protein [Azoarcus sp.]